MYARNRSQRAWQAGTRSSFLGRAGADVRRLLALSLATVCLVFVDSKTVWLQPVAWAVDFVVTPVYHVARFPNEALHDLVGGVASRIELVQEVERLRRELQSARARMLQYDAIRDENDQLRKLASASTRTRDELLMADVLEVSAERSEVVIDKGQSSGVYVDQAVILPEGVVGQVVSTSLFTSRVLLITARNHAVPVRVRRNNVLAIAAGTGGDKLVLKDAEVNIDVQPGDELVSSGLGQRFPGDYLVGKVVSVVSDQTEAFAAITVAPSAELDRSRQVLVVFADPRDATEETPPRSLATGMANAEPGG